MTLEVRPVTPGEIEGFARAEARGYGRHATQEYIVHGQHSLPVERTLATFEGDTIVGTSVMHPLRITVPGGELPLGGLAWVSVQPTHRDRGIMKQMVLQHLDTCREKGEPLCGLWAMNAGLYGRYGFAAAANMERWRIHCSNVRFLEPPAQSGRLIALSAVESRERFPAVYRQLRCGRSGVIARGEIFWDVEFEDREDQRRGRSRCFFTAYEREGTLDGYLKYRIDEASKTMVICELVSNNRDAYVALWSYCFHLDLVDTVVAENLPVGDALPWLLRDPRAVERTVEDGMWLRLVDVAVALTGRSYETQGRLILDIRDSICRWNEGRFALEIGADGASLKRTDEFTELSMDVAALGALYLGGISAHSLHAAGHLIEHRAGAARDAARLFSIFQPPWTLQVF